MQAACELFTIAGKKLDAETKSRSRFDGYFALLERWSRNARLATRVRFMIRDVLDLRRSKWIPRRETLQANFHHPPSSPF